jgi:hypothetical protein
MVLTTKEKGVHKMVSTTVSLASYAKLITAGVGKDFCELNSLISSGNTKLPSTTAIFNLSSAHDCPSLKLGLCKAYVDGKHVCYAKKAEYDYHPEVLPYRRKQEKFWLNITSNEFISQFLLINALKRLPFTALRFNEAGDFHSQECVDKAENIATVLKRYGVTTYGYTSRSDLDFSKAKNLIISGSSFMKEGIKNEFKIVKSKKDKPKGFGVCAGDCKVCTRCLVRGLKTVVILH